MKSYVFSLIQRIRSANQILIIDDMLAALANHDKRRLHQEKNNTRDLKARTFKNRNKSKDKARCEHCDRTDHTKEECWKLHSKQVPEWMKKKARWKIDKNSDSTVSTVKIVRSL